MAIFRKKCHRSSACIYQWILVHVYLHTIVVHENISSKFNFQFNGLKVKVSVDIFRKQNFVFALVPTFINEF